MMSRKLVANGAADSLSVNHVYLPLVQESRCLLIDTPARIRSTAAYQAISTPIPSSKRNVASD